VIDVGGGTSRLVDCLLDAGLGHVGVLDVSETALERTADRLGDRAALVQWIVSDATEFQPTNQWDLWHDRAVFHFLVDQSDQDRYRDVLLRSLEPSGHVVMATFGPRGPERCSGLPVVRRDPDGLQRALGTEFELLENLIEEHTTPKGAIQEFLYCRFRRS
jgi:ubiquinone/menaquinone biosynthesis C-methylase UbiE